MKKFDGILILSDIDGTFLWSASYIPPRNIEKIKYFTENGGHFAFASGRNHKDIFRAVPMVNELVNMPSVLCNGSYLYDAEKDDIIDPHYLNGEMTNKLLSEVREALPQIGIRITVREGFLVPDDDEIVRNQLTWWKITELANFKDFAEFDGEGYFKAVFIGDAETLQKLQPIYEKYKKYFDLTASTPTLRELQPLGVSKGSCLPYLRNRYQSRTLYAVGDYDNDAEMLKAADVAACPENAADRIKEISAIHLCSCQDGAIGDLIDKIEASLKNQ